MERKTLIPPFGPLQGMRILGLGSLVAMPFAANLMAEFGAEFIEIERPGIGDVYRTYPPVLYREGKEPVGAAWIQEARNRLSFTLELKKSEPDALRVFYDLIRESDFFIENMVWLEKFGITDEALLAVNPRLIIVHVSGFGRKEFGGDPEVCSRASYDIIGQAFSGYVYCNGTEETPMAVKPVLNDYVTAMLAVFGMLSAYLETQRSGRGQVIDVAQFEAQSKILRGKYVAPTLGLPEPPRTTARSPSLQPWKMYTCGDGDLVYFGAVGQAVFSRFMRAAGLSEEEFPFREVSGTHARVVSEIGRRFDRAICDWCLQHTAKEIVEILSAARVPCSRVNAPADCLQEPQYLLRNDFITSEDQTLGEETLGFGIVPKLSRTPGQIWRGAPRLGQDTEWILKDLLGYGDADIARLREKKLI